MILMPGLGLAGGAVVVRGADGTAVPVVDDPMLAARDLRAGGALFLHVQDLDAASGAGQADEVLARFADDMIGFQVAGGIGDEARAAALLELGASRVVLDPEASRDAAVAGALAGRFGVRVVGSLVVTDGRPCGHDGDVPAALAALTATGLQMVLVEHRDATGAPTSVAGADVQAWLEGVELGIQLGCLVPDVAGLAALEDASLDGIVLLDALGAASVPPAEAFARG